MAVEGTGVGGIITPLISPGGIGEPPGPTPTPIPGVHSLIIDPGDTPLSLMAPPYNARNMRLKSHTFTPPTWTRIAASSAETEGDVTAAVHTENAGISVEFEVVGDSPTDLRNRMRAVEAKIGKLRDPRRGGEVAWTEPSGKTVTWTVVGVQSYQPTYDDMLYKSRIASVQLGLIVEPYGLGTPVTVGTFQSSSSSPLLAATIPATIPGDAPALGTMRVVSDASLPGTTSTITWGIQGGADTSLPVLFEAEQQQPIASGSVLTDPTASNGQAWAATVGTTDTAVFALRTQGNTSMPHTGQFHVFARAGLVSGGNTQLQAMYWPGYRTDFAAGNGGIPNPWATVLSVTSGYSWVDLGVVDDARPDPAFGGWGLVLRARAVSGTSRVAIDNVFLVPTDDGYGQLISLLNQANDATITSDGARVTYNGATFDADLYFVDYFKVPAGVASKLVVRATSAKPLSEATGNFHDLPVPVTVSVTAVPRYLSMPA
jgi:hypothetical protein